MLTADGDLLAVTTYGPEDAPVTIFLAHCWTMDQQDWHYQVRDLMREFGLAVRIVTWDHRGHGGSDPVHGELETVTLGLPDAGPLLRSQIPRLLALRSRTLSRRARRRAPIVERLVMRQLVFGTPMRLSDAALAVEALIRCPAATLLGFYGDCIEHDRLGALARLEGIPTEVVVGSLDVLTPPSHARRIAAAIPGALLTVAPGAGHMLPLEREQLVSGVLARLVRPHAAAGNVASRVAS